MVEQLIRNRDPVDLGYTQDRLESCLTDHFVIARKEDFAVGHADAVLPAAEAPSLRT